MANSIVIEGNLTRDPEQTGNGPVKMSIAWNQSVKDKATGDILFFNEEVRLCEAFIEEQKGFETMFIDFGMR